MTYQRHPLEIGPLVFGLVFLGIVAAWALFELDVVSGRDAAWILPIVLIGAGALGVVLAATRPKPTTPVEYAPVEYVPVEYEPVEYAPVEYDEPDRYPTATAGADTDTTTETRAFADEVPQTKEHNDE